MSLFASLSTVQRTPDKVSVRLLDPAAYGYFNLKPYVYSDLTTLVDFYCDGKLIFTVEWNTGASLIMGNAHLPRPELDYTSVKTANGLEILNILSNAYNDTLSNDDELQECLDDLTALCGFEVVQKDLAGLYECVFSERPANPITNPDDVIYYGVFDDDNYAEIDNPYKD